MRMQDANYLRIQGSITVPIDVVVPIESDSLERLMNRAETIIKEAVQRDAPNSDVSRLKFEFVRA